MFNHSATRKIGLLIGSGRREAMYVAIVIPPRKPGLPDLRKVRRDPGKPGASGGADRVCGTT